MAAERIAIDASRAGGVTRTGTEWYSFEIIRALIAIAERPELTLYHRSAPPPELSGPRVHDRLVRRRRLWTHLGLSRAMLRDRPDGLFVPAHVIPLWHPISIVTIHDLGYLFYPEAHPAGVRRQLDLSTRWNARVARRIVAISGQTRDDLIRHYGAKPESIAVIHSAVDHERFQVIEPGRVQHVLDRHRIGPRYVLFLSTIQPRKNIVRLLEAFESLDDEALQLVIAGQSGWLSTPIEARIAASPATQRIRRIGYPSDDDVPALYTGASAFVLPSLYEGFGMGILEAMACGTPVVTSNCSSMPEVAGGAALLIDPLDVSSIRNGILQSTAPGERVRLIEAGLARVSSFMWERTASQTLAVIQRAIDGR